MTTDGSLGKAAHRAEGAPRAPSLGPHHEKSQQAVSLRPAAWLLLAPLLGLLIYWRVPAIWFQNDDFAWLGFASGVRGGRSLADAMFTPYAQGTVRVLSERLFFLVFFNAFGLHAVPYRVWTIATWIAKPTSESPARIPATAAGPR